MEDLKIKFLELINKQNQSRIPSMGLNPELLNPDEHCKRDENQSEHSHSIDSETIPDEDILESVEQVYFEADGNFDSCRHVLTKFSQDLNCKNIEKYSKKLKQQQQVISKKVLQLILQKQTTCNQEFSEILKIQDQLKSLLEVCQTGRKNLNSAKLQFTTASLGILANYKKRQTVQKLLHSLNTIKTLQRTEDRLQELLAEENYPGAISLLLECQSVAQTYKHFRCVAALNGKLQDTLEQAEETLDVTLSRICQQFNEKTYCSIHQAYKLLGKTQIAIDQLHMHFTATIHSTAFAVVHSYAGGDMKRQYKQLCQSISQQNLINCLIDLSKALWKIIYSYYQVLSWHNTNSKHIVEINNDKESDGLFSQQYVKQKLETGMARIWHDVEIKVSMLLISADITTYKFEHFVQILGTINRLTEVGKELCDSKSENLQKSMKEQCSRYFFHYHASRLDELRIFLEHDGWELCPVKSTFVATQLQEFKSLRPALVNCKSWNSIEDLNVSVQENSTTNSGWLQKYLENDMSPFDIGLDETIDEDILANLNDEECDYISEESDDDLDEEFKIEFISRKDNIRASKRKPKPTYVGPMVTNTTLNVLRVCGRYLQMSRLLSSIAVDVIQKMVQFFELCLYTIYLFFTSDLQITSDKLYSPKLKLTLARIKESLIIDETSEDTNNSNHKVRCPQLSSIVNLTQDDKLYGLAERVVGVESLIFLGQQYESLQSFLKQLIASSPERGFLNQFYIQTIESATDLRKPVYMAVVSKFFDVTNILNLMNRVNWEVKDVMSQHSDYVDSILQECKVFAKRLEDISYIVPLSVEVKNAIWENVAHLITHTLVEGFSNTKKCSNGGRGLMQLDFTQLKSKFEMITNIRPMPHSEYVELYVKAYYIPENTLEEWVKEHKEYSVKHLVGLISCACQNNKKSRQRLIGVIEGPRSNR
ncbi:syndetin [Chelonus insularis]|uniref:syndetin n=1 Tax=Chelonus insularis TaxID=460826 RepID=UPI00158CD394|nr:syndetin [Chelonus insularis]